MGPNRRSERTAIELSLAFNPSESEAIRQETHSLKKNLVTLLADCGLDPSRATSFFEHVHDDPVLNLGELFCGTAILLQNTAGHRVRFTRVLKGHGESHYRFIYEREESDTGEKAGDLAFIMLKSLVPGLEWTPYTVADTDDARELTRQFMAFATPLAMPAESLAIIEAAERLDIPVIKLERDPYEAVTGKFRVLPNGLLMLGHSRHQQIIDGTICVTRSQAAMPLVFDRHKRRHFLSRLGLFAAPGVTPDFKLLLANNEVLACLSCKNDENGNKPAPAHSVHPHVAEQVRRIAKLAQAGLLEVSVSTPDVSQPLAQTGGAFVDFQPAPSLAEYAKADPVLLKRAAEGFMRWLFPEGAKSRIPTVVVTGTNGKSTTTTMVAHVMKEAGCKVGAAHTEGVIIDGEQQEIDDMTGLRGAYRVFESREVDMAVLETPRGGVLSRGFAFNRCDVAVCLNVTSDHLGLNGIHTLEQMAGVKRSIVERARNGAVLNADDPHCISMLRHVPAANTCLVSMKSGFEKLSKAEPSVRFFCVLEESGGDDWIVLYEDGSRRSVTRINDIPATMGGIIEFNTCNAMHAIAACRLAGIGIETISGAISTYRSGRDVLIGRMNFFEGFPFRVLVDYAHNPDGIVNLLETIKRLPVSGRRIIVFGVAGDRDDQTIADTARPLAGLFDHYFPKNYPDLRGRQPMEVPLLLKQALVEAGVHENSVTPLNDELQAITAGLEMCRGGDFLVLLPGHANMRDAWQMLSEMAARQS
jgi:UDP-N-acetylmuramyl tripeptide synthase